MPKAPLAGDEQRVIGVEAVLGVQPPAVGDRVAGEHHGCARSEGDRHVGSLAKCGPAKAVAGRSHRALTALARAIGSTYSVRCNFVFASDSSPTNAYVVNHATK